MWLANPGAVSRTDWKNVAYKGGSETGVLNLTTRVRDDLDRTYCVSMGMPVHSIMTRCCRYTAAYFRFWLRVQKTAGSAARWQRASFAAPLPSSALPI